MHSRPLRTTLSFAALVVMAGCSSKQGTSDLDGGGLTGTPQNQNPQGVPYPTAHLGTGQRGLDGTGAPEAFRGNVIPNYKFLGYPDGDATKPLETVSLADYYDPHTTKYKLLHIIAASEWCLPCGQETDALVAALKVPATDYTAQGVVFLEALVEGNAQNVGATTADLTAWIGAHHPTFAEVLDPEAQNLGELFNAAAVPFNADIDVRTMEILQAGTGYANVSELAVWLDWVGANPPSYPVPQ
jgi:hypothetical protein